MNKRQFKNKTREFQGLAASVCSAANVNHVNRAVLSGLNLEVSRLGLDNVALILNFQVYQSDPDEGNDIWSFQTVEGYVVERSNYTFVYEHGYVDVVHAWTMEDGIAASFVNLNNRLKYVIVTDATITGTADFYMGRDFSPENYKIRSVIYKVDSKVSLAPVLNAFCQRHPRLTAS